MTPKKRKSDKKTSTKDRIIDAAVRLFAKHGYHATSIQQIADVVGISQPGVFIHFKNKLLLFKAVRERVAVLNRQYVDALVGIRDDARTALEKHCVGNLVWYLENRQYSQITLLLYYFSCQDTEMKSLNQAALSAGEERIRRYVYAAIRERLVHTKKPDYLAREIHAYLIGQGIKYLSLEKSPAKAEITKHIRHFLHSILK